MTQVLNHSENRQRHHALDALRVIAFGVLILYHIGMYYVLEWGWHIKSPIQFEWLQDVMILTNQWRMSLLFLISSMVLSSVLLNRYQTDSSEHRSGKWFRSLSVISERTQRILIPLIFGMFVIVAPQVYIEWSVNGIIDSTHTSFTDFYLSYINPNTLWLPDKQSDIGLLTWNHLWFLPYLFVYSVLLVAFFPVLKLIQRLPRSLADNLLIMSVVVVGVMVFIWLMLKSVYPTTHDLLNDWYNHAKYGFVMLVGALLIMRPVLWEKMVHYRRQFLLVGVMLYALIIADRHDMLGPVGSWMSESLWFRIFVGIIVVANHWSWLAAILGYGKRYFSQPRQWVSYLNKGVLPYYMMHQTLIVMAAYYLQPYSINPILAFVFIISFTLVGCAATYELVRRIPVVRRLFGLKNTQTRIYLAPSGIKKAV